MDRQVAKSADIFHSDVMDDKSPQSIKKPSFGCLSWEIVVGAVAMIVVVALYLAFA